MKLARSIVVPAVLAVLTWAAAGGCEPDADAARRAHVLAKQRARRAAAARAAAGESIDSDVSATGGKLSLHEQLAALTTPEACVAALDRETPAAVEELLADVGYEEAARDACAGLFALRDRSSRACDALSTFAARRGCRTRLAAMTGEATDCPSAETIAGRDVVCLAWATGDARLCAAAASLDEPRCRAVLAGRADLCEASLDITRPRCRREVARYGEVLRARVATSARAARRDPFSIADDFTLTRPGTEPTRVAMHALARGVVVEPDACLQHLTLGATPEVGSDADVQLELWLPATFRLPLTLPLSPRRAVVRWRAPDGEHGSSESSARGAVVLEGFTLTRGAPLTGSLRLTTTSHAGAAVGLAGRFATYVRDFTPLSDACARIAGSATSP